MSRGVKKLAAAALAGAASILTARSAAQAALTVTWIETPNVMTQDGLFDQYNFKLTAITGADNVTGPRGQDPEVLLLEATWTASNHGVLLVPGANVTNPSLPPPGGWMNYIATAPTDTPSEPSPTYKSSYLNLPGLFATESRSGAGSASATASGAVTAIHGTSTSFTAHWDVNNPGSTAGPAGGIEPSVNGGALATIYVTHGDAIYFTGDYGTYETVDGNPVTTSESFAQPVVLPPHNIISLTSTTQAGGIYGLQFTTAVGQYQATFSPNAPAANTINVTKTGTSVSPGFADNIDAGPGDPAGFAALSGFAPADQEIYALKLLVGTTAPTSAQISQIAGDISAQSGDGISSVANLLSPAGNALAAQIAAAFPGYDLMLVVNTGSGSATPYLGFDFTQEVNVPGVVVTDIVATVPEPPGSAALLIAASGLLLSRRKSLSIRV